LVAEPDNPVDPEALLVTTVGGTALGWVPAPLLPLLDLGTDVRASVAHVNGSDSPPHQRLLVELRGGYPAAGGSGLSCVAARGLTARGPVHGPQCRGAWRSVGRPDRRVQPCARLTDPRSRGSSRCSCVTCFGSSSSSECAPSSFIVRTTCSDRI